MSRRLFPVLIDLRYKNVVVLAGRLSCEDKVLRIMHALSSCTNHLTLFSPSPSGRLKEEAGTIPYSLTQKEYDREDMYGADVVILTGEDALLADEVHAACRTLGIRLCIPSEPWRSDFILPDGFFE